ncbi:hypothetical protein A2U01_0109942, partial [Trifolium medium]|nr:hypothetical protein [Trifolium medium]
MQRLDEDKEPRCYCVEVIEDSEDKCKGQPLSPHIGRITIDAIDAQEAEWEHEIEIFLQ